MDIKVCKDCGRMYNYYEDDDGSICPVCSRKQKESYEKVKKYIYEHSGTSLEDVVKECEVPKKLIMRWVKEGRLEFAKGVDIGLKCSKCGKPISKGMYCSGCTVSLANEFSKVTEELASVNDKSKKDCMHSNEINKKY